MNIFLVLTFDPKLLDRHPPKVKKKVRPHDSGDSLNFFECMRRRTRIKDPAGRIFKSDIQVALNFTMFYCLDLLQPTSLAIDFTDLNVFWCDLGSHSIGVASLRDSYKSNRLLIIDDDIVSPISVAINAVERYKLISLCQEGLSAAPLRLSYNVNYNKNYA